MQAIAAETGFLASLLRDERRPKTASIIPLIVFEEVRQTGNRLRGSADQHVPSVCVGKWTSTRVLHQTIAGKRRVDNVKGLSQTVRQKECCRALGQVFGARDGGGFGLKNTDAKRQFGQAELVARYVDGAACRFFARIAARDRFGVEQKGMAADRRTSDGKEPRKKQENRAHAAL